MKIVNVFKFMQTCYDKKTNTGPYDVEWLFEEFDDCIMLGVRGTELMQGWWTIDVLRNICALIPYKSSFGWVSLGYYLGAKHTVPQILTKLQDIHYNGEKPLILCGHSLGSVISFFIAKQLDLLGLPIRAWVGTGTLNCTLTVQTIPNFALYNFKYEEDASHIYPFKFLGFKQPCEIIHIGKDNSVFGGDVDDHDLNLYIQNAPDISI